MLRHTDPMTQVIILGFVCFCCPAMFNAIGGLGAFGLPASEAKIANNAGTALNAVFAVSSLVAGGLFNLFGHRWLLLIGGLTYTLYVSSYFAYSYIHSVAFTVVAACILGLGAGWLWCAQGAIMMGYPLEGDKGKYFGIFWAIFNAGGVVGNMIPMAMSWNDGNKAKQVSTATYIVFMCITAFGAVLSLLLLPASKITRNDGSPVTKVKFSSPIIEVRGILSLFKDWRMLALFPMFFTSNWFYTYQFNLNAVNSASIRSRSFDSAFYWGAQVVASLAFGVLLDRPQWTRSTRGRYGFVILVAILIATWGGAIGFQSGVGPRNIIDTDGVYSTAPGDFESLDLIDTTGEWIKFFLLYIMFGACDAMFQAYAYWLMGSLSNDIHVVARYSGFYKFAQNIGGIFAGQVANSRISNTAEHLNIATTHGMGELGVCIALLAFSVICATPVVLKAIQDTTVEDVFEEEQKQKQEYADDANV